MCVSTLGRLGNVGLAVAVWLSLVEPGHAQSIRDTVREHLEQGLESAPAQETRPEEPHTRRKPAASGAAKTGPASPPPAALSEPAGDVGETNATETTPASPEEFPKRVFGKNLQLDPQFGVGYRGWYPDQYPLVRVAPAGYFTWSVDLKAKLFGFLRLHRGYYESNGLAGPRTEGAVVAQKVGRIVPKAAWLLGALGVPVSKRWETLVSYESRSFVTRARPSAPVAVVDRNTSGDTDFSTLTRSTDALRFVSGFETLVLGVRYSPDVGEASAAGLFGDSAGPLPPMYLGVGFTQYSKPYQVKVGSDTLDELLFNGRFRGAGIAYGLALPRHLARPYLDLDTQLGLGQVQLLNDLTVNELLPEDWLIGYLQGNVTLGYALPVLHTRPTPIFAGEISAGGATFFYFQTKRDGSGQAPSLPLNWDFLWAAHVSLTLPL